MQMLVKERDAQRAVLCRVKRMRVVDELLLLFQSARLLSKVRRGDEVEQNLQKSRGRVLAYKHACGLTSVPADLCQSSSSGKPSRNEMVGQAQISTAPTQPHTCGTLQPFETASPMFSVRCRMPHALEVGTRSAFVGR